MHEIAIIDRLRMKRAWEKETDTVDSMEKSRKIIAEIENSDWAFREQVNFSMSRAAIKASMVLLIVLNRIINLLTSFMSNRGLL